MSTLKCKISYRCTYLRGKGIKEIPSSGNHRNIRWKTVTPQIILCPFGRNRTVFWKDKEKEKKNGSNIGPPIERDYY